MVWAQIGSWAFVMALGEPSRCTDIVAAFCWLNKFNVDIGAIIQNAFDGMEALSMETEGGHALHVDGPDGPGAVRLPDLNVVPAAPPMSLTEAEREFCPLDPEDEDEIDEPSDDWDICDVDG